MTFGYGSPGFNPIWCPPCSEGSVCNTVCLDPIDGPILIVGMLAFSMIVAVGARRFADSNGKVDVK
jgi:hypothetical protein